MSNSKFLHEEIYRGEAKVKALGKKHITICGAGTVGSNLAETLARQGVLKLRLIDMDRVEKHNVSTQIYGDKDVGAKKVAAARNRLFRDVGIQIEHEDKELKSNNVKKFLKKTDLVVDTFDNSASRQLIQDFCREVKQPCLHVGLHEDYGEVAWDQHYTVPGDVDGDVCEYPLARNLSMLAVSVAAEEIMDYFLAEKSRLRSWAITLKDMKIGPYR